MKKTKCPKCGNTDRFIEVCDNLWSEDYYEWNEKIGKYSYIENNTGGEGTCWWECEVCRHNLGDTPYDKIEFAGD